jgi:glycine/serine hydroxymethyltransferase
MDKLAGWICDALRRHQDTAFLASLRAEVESLCLAYPVPGLPALETARR